MITIPQALIYVSLFVVFWCVGAISTACIEVIHLRITRPHYKPEDIVQRIMREWFWYFGLWPIPLLMFLVVGLLEFPRRMIKKSVEFAANVEIESTIINLKYPDVVVLEDKGKKKSKKLTTYERGYNDWD